MRWIKIQFFILVLMIIAICIGWFDELLNDKELNSEKI